MQILVQKNNILIISNKASNILSKINDFKETTDTKKPMGFAIPPFFIILRNLTHPMTQQWINHESIHIRQFIESIGLFWIYSKLEYLYARVLLKYSYSEAHKYESIEQEAYLNQHDESYLSKRSFLNTIRYIKHKTNFYTDDDYKVIIENE